MFHRVCFSHVLCATTWNNMKVTQKGGGMRALLLKRVEKGEAKQKEYLHWAKDAALRLQELEKEVDTLRSSMQDLEKEVITLHQCVVVSGVQSEFIRTSS